MWEYLFVVKSVNHKVSFLVLVELKVAALESLQVRVYCCSCGNKWETCGSVEFLRKLIVGVAAPSDLARSFLVEILHCGEGEVVEQVARTLKQISVFEIALLSLLTCIYIFCMLILFISLYTWYYFCSVDLHALDFLIL